jgi:hypothetical protein
MFQSASHRSGKTVIYNAVKSTFKINIEQYHAALMCEIVSCDDSVH